jgi:hypothetical protein
MLCEDRTRLDNVDQLVNIRTGLVMVGQVRTG